MGAAMNPLNMSDTPAAPNRSKGRWQLILILLMVIGPMVLPQGTALLDTNGCTGTPAAAQARRHRAMDAASEV